jgi:hypothetical protein
MAVYAYCVIVANAHYKPNFDKFYHIRAQDLFLNWLSENEYTMTELSSSISIFNPPKKGESCFVYFFDGNGCLIKSPYENL